MTDTNSRNGVDSVKPVILALSCSVIRAVHPLSLHSILAAASGRFFWELPDTSVPNGDTPAPEGITILLLNPKHYPEMTEALQRAPGVRCVAIS